MASQSRLWTFPDGWLPWICGETPLEKETMEAVRRERSQNDWLICQVTQHQFQGQGDTQKLQEILRVFEEWAGKPRAPR